MKSPMARGGTTPDNPKIHSEGGTEGDTPAVSGLAARYAAMEPDTTEIDYGNYGGRSREEDEAPAGGVEGGGAASGDPAPVNQSRGKPAGRLEPQKRMSLREEKKVIEPQPREHRAEFALPGAAPPEDKLPPKPVRTFTPAPKRPERRVEAPLMAPTPPAQAETQWGAPPVSPKAASTEPPPRPTVQPSPAPRPTIQTAAPRPEPPRPPAFTPPPVGRVEEGWFRIELPSRCVPYRWGDVHARVLDIPDLIGIHAAVENYEKSPGSSYSMFLDALDSACNVDIRDLTGPDLRFLMYWWRINSFSRSPYTFPWTSRYGNRNKKTIYNESELTITELAMTHEEFAAYQAKGICFPTVRDAEYTGIVQPTGTDKMLANRAQYVVADPVGSTWYQSRFARLKTEGTGLWEDIRDFASSIEHGVIEQVKVFDEYYEPRAAAEALRRSAGLITSIVDATPDNQLNPDILFNQGVRVDELLAEAEAIEEVLLMMEEGVEGAEERFKALAPKEEVIELSISAMNFFPGI